MFDPNGPDSHTNDYINSSIMDTLFKTYIHIFNICHEEQYTYLFLNDWYYYSKKNNYQINTIYLEDKEKNIRAGHCVILTLLIAHLLTITKYNCHTIILKLSKINNKELFKFLMEYTQMVINKIT